MSYFPFSKQPSSNDPFSNLPFTTIIGDLRSIKSSRLFETWTEEQYSGLVFKSIFEAAGIKRKIIPAEERILLDLAIDAKEALFGAFFSSNRAKQEKILKRIAKNSKKLSKDIGDLGWEGQKRLYHAGLPGGLRRADGELGRSIPFLEDLAFSAQQAAQDAAEEKHGPQQSQIRNKTLRMIVLELLDIYAFFTGKEPAMRVGNFNTVERGIKEGQPYGPTYGFVREFLRPIQGDSVETNLKNIVSEALAKYQDRSAKEIENSNEG